VARFLTPEWFVETRRLGAASTPHAGVSGRVQLVISGAPDGDVKCSLVVEDGRIVDAAVGDLADAELTMTLDYATAVEIQQGSLDPNVAFMQGRSKAAGNTGTLLHLLPLTRTDGYRAFQEQLRAVTEY
jgi:putative sterol carrier protein